MTQRSLAKIFKALGDETRLEIVRMLVGKERCVCAFLSRFPMSQPAISNHLRVLREAGFPALADCRHSVDKYVLNA